MQTAEVVLNVLRERGRKGLPCTQGLRRNVQSGPVPAGLREHLLERRGNDAGVSEETAEGMSEAKIEQITGLMRREKYRFSRPAASTSRRRTGGSAPSACQHGPIN